MMMEIQNEEENNDDFYLFQLLGMLINQRKRRQEEEEMKCICGSKNRENGVRRERNMQLTPKEEKGNKKN